MTAATTNRDYAYGLARAFAGAILFGLPLLMTMEMWSLGLYTHPARLLLFMALNFVVLVFLSRFGGFERTSTLVEDVLDALAAYGVGILGSAAVLALFGVLKPGMPVDEMAGMIAIQSVPASFGAMIARKQLSAGETDMDAEHEARSAGYAGQLFLMMAGALFLAFNVAPTEEMILIGFKMTPWHSLALIVASLALLHALVFSIGFAGQEQAPEGYGFDRRFLIYTVPGYAIALLISFYTLWTFGRADGGDIGAIAATVVVLGFPAAIGAAVARLVV
jgi:putative integral membrane protein (TIGR02587 family)